MSDLIVKPVETRHQRKQFLELPWALYRDDPYWIPPLRQNQRELVGYCRHPFYLENEAQTFLATRHGKPCGRVAAILNHAHNRVHDERLGFFGFFESIDDAEVATGLLDAVRDWFAERDVRVIRGPCNPSLNYEAGLLIEGFDASPVFMMTYNPAYYERLLEDYGFRKSQDMFAYTGRVEMLRTVGRRLQAVVHESSKRLGITLHRLDASQMLEEIRVFVEVFNRSMARSWGHVPLTEAELNQMAHAFRHLVAPELAVTALIDGKPIGVGLALPDYNPRIKQINGRLFPLGFLRLLRNRKQIKRIRVISANVLPEYQMTGVGVVLFARIVTEAMAWGVQEGEFSWVMESNHLSRKSLEHGGAEQTKTYRIYDYHNGR